MIKELNVFSKDTLVEIHDFLLLFVTGKSKKALITFISNHIQTKELQELEDKTISYLLHFQDSISELQAAPKHGIDNQINSQGRMGNDEPIKKDQEKKRYYKK